MKSVFIAISIICVSIFFSCGSGEKTAGNIKAGGLSVHYESSGVGKPVLLLHAGLQESSMWAAQVAALAPHYRVITIDMPGHGKTTGIDTAIVIADVIKAVMDSLQIPKASVMGLSLGAVAATDFALAYPQMMDKLILVSPGINCWQGAQAAMDSASKHSLDSLDKAYATNDTAVIANQFTRTWCDGPYRNPAQVNTAARAYILSTTARTISTHHLKGFPKLSTPPAAERISGIQCPTLIMDGDKDISVIIGACKALHSAIESSQLITFPGVAHMLNMEIPAAFNAAVLKFLQQ